MSSITAVVLPGRIKLTPEIPYETLESLIPAESRSWFSYPDPTYVLVPLSRFSRPTKSYKKIPLARPDETRIFDLDFSNHPILRDFETYESSLSGQVPNWRILADVAARYDDVFLAFRTGPTSDRYTRSLKIAVEYCFGLGLPPLIFNAKESDRKLPPDSFTGHTDLYCGRGNLVAQIVKSPGNFLGWQNPNY